MAVVIRGQMPDEDAQLPIAADWSTFTEIFRGYAEYVFDYCITVLGDENEAAAATTVTFMAAQVLLGRLRDQDRLEAWLYALARRECTSKHPARAEPQPEAFWPSSGRPDQDQAYGDSPAPLPRREPPARPDAAAPEAAAPAADRKRAARRVLSAFSQLSEDDREVLAAFSALSAADREVLDLVYWHGLAPAELPAILGLPAQRAQALLAEAVHRFRLAAEEIAAAAGEQAAGDDRLFAAMPEARMPASVWRRASPAVFYPGPRE
jgi:DNA-directed RNA polymerase specialized sigma24 family protein